MEFMTIHQQPTMCQAFVAGEYAQAMEALPEETVKQHAVWLLANATGQEVPEPTFFRRSVRVPGHCISCSSLAVPQGASAYARSSLTGPSGGWTSSWRDPTTPT